MSLTAKQFEGKKRGGWGSSFNSGSWNGGKHSARQACPWPVPAVGHPAPAIGTCHWPWGQYVGKTLLLPESSLLKWGVFSSSYLSAQLTLSKFVLICDLRVSKMLMTWIQSLVMLIAMMVSHGITSANWLVNVRWEELLDWMGQNCSVTWFGNVGVTNVTNFSDFCQKKLVTILTFENWKVVVSRFFK